MKYYKSRQNVLLKKMGKLEMLHWDLTEIKKVEAIKLNLNKVF